jgi:hypothetical protein
LSGALVGGADEVNPADCADVNGAVEAIEARTRLASFLENDLDGVGLDVIKT